MAAVSFSFAVYAGLQAPWGWRGGDGPRAACHPRPIHGERTGVATAPFQLGLISRLGCMAIFLGVWPLVCIDNQYRLQLLIRFPHATGAPFQLNFSVMCEIQATEAVCVYVVFKAW